ARSPGRRSSRCGGSRATGRGSAGRPRAGPRTLPGWPARWSRSCELLLFEHVDARVPPGAVTRDLQPRVGLAFAGGGLDAQLRQARLTDLGLRGDQRELRQARELGLTRVGGLDAQLR